MKTNKIILTLIIGLFTSIISAQVGVGTTTPAATADITALNPTGTTTGTDGLLIPRVTRQRAKSMATITTSTLIYVDVLGGAGNMTGKAINIDAVGFYYFDGSVWQKLNSSAAASNDWTILGNTGTTPGTNFLGTTDAQDFRIKTNNADRWNISNANSGQLQPYSRGTVALPIYSFQSDTNTGIFSSGADVLNFSTNGIERIKIKNAETVVNDGGIDHDFRIESDLESNMFMLNASDDQVFIKANAQHLGYIDALNVYSNSVGSATSGIQYSIAGWNQGNQGGGGNFVIEDATNGYAAMEAATSGNGIASRGVITQTTGGAWAVAGTSNDATSYGVYGSVPNSNGATGLGGIFTGGLGYVNGAYNLSDSRAKRDIKRIDSALDKILNIEGYTYKYDEHKFNKKATSDNHTYYGFMAQNIKEFLPHAVAEKKVHFRNDKIDARSKKEDSGVDEILNVVDYTAVIPVLVEAMKEQQELIKLLEARIKQLEKK